MMPPPGMYMQPGTMPMPGMMYHPGMPPPPPPAPMAPPMPMKPEDAEDAARRIRTAFKGLGTDDKDFIATVSAFNKMQLCQISGVYFQRFGVTLEEAIRKELSGSYRELALTIIKPPYKLEASLISSSLKKGEIDYECISEILGTRTGYDLQVIAAQYNSTASLKPGKEKKKKDKPKDFVTDILEKTKDHKDFNGWFSAILRNVRPNTPADDALVARDADDLIKAAKGAGTDEVIFFDILARRSFPHLAKVSDELAKKRKKDLVKLIESEFSRGTERALVACAMMTKSPAHAQAYILYRSMKGAGTAEDRLIRTLAYIYDNPLREATKRAYQEMYGKDLIKVVKSETSFNFEKLAVALLEFKGADLK